MYLNDKFFSHLAPHVEFDPKAFIPDNNVSKDLCAFILTLSLLFNDFKTIAYFHNMLSEQLPEASPKRTNGEVGGLRLHLIRLNVALIFELFNLIDKNRKLLDDNFFKNVIRSTELMTRECWENIVEASDQNNDFNKSKTNPFYMVRTKTIAHYEKDDILEGFVEGFLKADRSLPCLSRGGKIGESRFYFADKAIAGYIAKRTAMKEDDFYKRIQQLSQDASISLVNICTAYITQRKCSFKPAKD